MALANTTTYTELDILIKSGDNLSIKNAKFSVKVNGEYENLILYTSGVLKVRASKDETSTAIYDFTTAGGGLVFADGYFYLVGSSAEMDLDAGKYWYELELVDGDGETHTAMQGLFEVEEDV